MAGKLLIIAGPTGVGKSALAMDMAERLGQPLFYFEPVIAYQELTIGSAKPTVEDRARVVHHGVDMTDLRHPLTLGDIYRRLAPEIGAQLTETGTALVVTGSGFFLRALIQGMPAFHSEAGAAYLTKEAIFAQIVGRDYPECEQDISEAERHRCYEALQSIWPKRATKLHPNDSYRVMRSLEVAHNEFETHPELKDTDQIEGLGTESVLPRGTEVVPVIIYRDADDYEAGLYNRVCQMMANGWVAEVQDLIARHYPLQGALKSVGYRELYAYLEEHPEGPSTPAEYEVLVTLLSRSHRQLSRKQLKWFKNFDFAIGLNHSQNDRIKLVSFMVKLLEGK